MIDNLSPKVKKALILLTHIVNVELKKEPELSGKIIINFNYGGITTYEVISSHKIW